MEQPKRLTLSLAWTSSPFKSPTPPPDSTFKTMICSYYPIFLWLLIFVFMFSISYFWSIYVNLVFLWVYIVDITKEAKMSKLGLKGACNPKCQNLPVQNVQLRRITMNVPNRIRLGPYIIRKPRMSTFFSILQISNSALLGWVMIVWMENS